MKYQGWRSVTYAARACSTSTIISKVGRPGLRLPADARLRPDHAVHRHPPPHRRFGAGHRAGVHRRVRPVRARARPWVCRQGDKGPQSRAEGRFTITTDGEILTNNSEDGPVAGNRGAGPLGRRCRRRSESRRCWSGSRAAASARRGSRSATRLRSGRRGLRRPCASPCWPSGPAGR